MDNEEQVEGGDPRTPGISAATIARFIVLLLGLVNVGAALWAWWKDNPITPKSRAKHAQ